MKSYAMRKQPKPIPQIDVIFISGGLGSGLTSLILLQFYGFAFIGFLKILRVWVRFSGLTGFELKKYLKLAIFHQFLTSGFKFSKFSGIFGLGFGNFEIFRIRVFGFG